LEKFQRQLLKKILTLSINTPDSAIFIVTGFLPVIAQIERKALTIFNNICRQKDNAIEKRIGLRQLTVKDMDSNSWFIAIKKMLYKYKLLDPITLMNNPPRKLEWKNLSILHSTNTGQTC
jgi:nucleoside recognition membrane protein YjiH